MWDREGRVCRTHKPSLVRRVYHSLSLSLNEKNFVAITRKVTARYCMFSHGKYTCVKKLHDFLIFLICKYFIVSHYKIFLVILILKKKKKNSMKKQQKADNIRAFSISTRTAPRVNQLTPEKVECV